MEFLIVILAAAYAGVRNLRVTIKREQILKDIHRQTLRDPWGYDSSWRYQQYGLISHIRMFLEFWRSVETYYDGMTCTQPYEEILGYYCEAE